MAYSLRYYRGVSVSAWSPELTQESQRFDSEVRSLLSEIERKHGIHYEVIELRMKRSSDGSAYMDEDHEREIYYKEFLPRSKVFKKRGFSVTDLRSNRGHVYIARRVAVTSNGLIEWFTHYDERFNGKDENPTLAFLKALLERGKPLLDELCVPISTSPANASTESLILDRLEAYMRVRLQREVPAGSNELTLVDGSKIKKEFTMKKYIDAVCEYQGKTWIIEAKEVLNYEAIGQVLVYEDLYKREYKRENIQKVIACQVADQELLPTCKRLGIVVYLVGENTRKVV